MVITSITESFSIVILEAIINKTKIVCAPIKELEKSNLSEYINFSSSRTPKDISKKIIEVSQNKFSVKVKSKALDNIIGLYFKQSKDILRWLR